MDSALSEFSKQGYGASSINTICAAKDISKGIIYHYFETKDALFLACVGECFSMLADHIRTHIDQEERGTAEDQLEAYFTARMDFFQRYPAYKRIFCEATITPPSHLNAEIQERKRDFDILNMQIMERLLAPAALRPDLERTDIIEIFRIFQDFVNVRYQMAGMDAPEFEVREADCRRIPSRSKPELRSQSGILRKNFVCCGYCGCRRECNPGSRIHV